MHIQMQSQTLRLGTYGGAVTKWQTFLRGLDLYQGEVHGRFDMSTAEATKAFQTSRGLTPDGIAGNMTLGTAMTEGFLVVTDTGFYDDFDKSGPEWPPVPTDLRAPSLEDRQRLFGAFYYTPAPVERNPEAIQIRGSWVQDNIVNVEVPQLKGVSGAGAGKVLFHKALVPQLLGLFQAWENTGLIHLVKTWGGAWAPRFVRGSRTSLSDHAWASAFDINVAWNGLGVRPALVGQTGSVRELVPLANRFGAFWGGHYRTRLDGMHFGFAKILSEEEVSNLLAKAV